MLKIEILSWLIFPLMNMKYPSSSYLITFGWKSILLDIRMATLACFLKPFAWKTFFNPFTLSYCLSLLMRHVTCTHQNSGSSLGIQSLSLCLFIRGWVHYYWEILKTDDSSWYVCFYKWLYMLMFFSFWLCYKMLSILSFVWSRYLPCVGVFLLGSSVGLDW